MGIARINPPVPASVIEDCSECQFCDDYEGSWNAHYLHCRKLGMRVGNYGNPAPIPDNCPLEKVHTDAS